MAGDERDPVRPLTIEHARLFDPRTDEVAESTIHLADGIVAGLGGATPAGADVLDADGRLVVAGLIDAHFHAYGVGLDVLEIEAAPSSYVAAAAAQRLERALRRGFTTVRDVAGGDLGLVRALDEGLIEGPRYLFAGRALPRPAGTAIPDRAGSICAAAATATSARSSTASTTCVVPCASASAPART